MSETSLDKKLKRRHYGTFNCDHPECSKVFVRHDHLLRHQRNHDPGRQIACGWPKCNATFARTDVREKHYKRHLMKLDKVKFDGNGLNREDIESPESTTSVSSPSNNSPNYSSVTPLGHSVQLLSEEPEKHSLGSTGDSGNPDINGTNKRRKSQNDKEQSILHNQRSMDQPTTMGQQEIPNSGNIEHIEHIKHKNNSIPMADERAQVNGSQVNGSQVNGSQVNGSQMPVHSSYYNIYPEQSAVTAATAGRAAANYNFRSPQQPLPHSATTQHPHSQQKINQMHRHNGNQTSPKFNRLYNHGSTNMEFNLLPINAHKSPTPMSKVSPYEHDTKPQINDARKGLSPSDLIEWLFHDETLSQTEPSEGDHPSNSASNNNNMVFPQKQPIEFPNGVSPMSLLESMFAVSPNFPHSNNRKTIDVSVRAKLVGLIPQLDLNPDFGMAQIERCLEIYWLIFHPQFPLLHKPSFSNHEAHPLLLLAMIMLGASLSSCTGNNEMLFTDAQRLSNEIAEPLRWLIFANPDCRPPAKVWVVQSLLLLETYEITSSSRVLHERAYLHHGTKIQLLRRSPILGGDPLKDDEDDGAYLPPNHVWKKWIEVESMKRATLMAFYLDTVNATVYGHMVVLYAHQIKISLPCEDELWEFDNNNPNQKLDSLLAKERAPKFLVALRKVLHRQPVKTSTFGRKVLLAGLLTIMFQMQQKDLQLSFLEWNQVKDSWNETISLAIDVWRTDICSKGCCNTENSLKFSTEEETLLPPMLRSDDKRCKFSLYHIAQIYMRITHYDYIIYAGAPSRMNVVAGNSEYTVVEKRVINWAKSLNGRISVVHAYLFLCEMLLSPDNEDIIYSYDPNVDPFLHRKNIMASAILVIFAYNFSLEGPEDNLFSNPQNIIGGYYPDKEDGYDYLKRIRKLLSNNFGEGGDNFHTNKSVNSTTFHNRIKIFADILLKIPNKNRIVGLLKLFYKSFKDCKWEVGAEYSKLFQNCIERCLGRKKITCDDMYASSYNNKV